MAEVIEIPFNAGQDESSDKILMPEGLLRTLKNCRLTRDNRLEVRPQYTALDMDGWETGANIAAYDLTTFEDKLLTFAKDGTENLYPTQVFTYVDAGRAAWKGLFDISASPYIAFPLISELEHVWHAPSGVTMTSSDVAYTNGYVCLVSNNPATTATRVWILKGSTVVNTQSISSCVSGRVVACGNTFVLLTRLSSGSITARTFDTTTAGAFSSATTLVTTLATGTFTWDATPVVGSTDFVIAYPEPVGTDIEVERWSVGLVNSWKQTINVTPGNMCVIADTTHVCVCYVDAATNAILYTRNATTGAAVAGPTTVLGPGAFTPSAACVGTPALSFISSANIAIECSANTSVTMQSLNTVFTRATHLEISTWQAPDVFISSKLFSVDRDNIDNLALGVGSCTVFGNTLGTDMLYASIIQGVNDWWLLSARWNYGYADRMADSLATNYHGRSSIVTDGSGTYWAVVGILDEGSLLTSNAGTAQLVSFKAGSASRRQNAEMQGALYTAGGFVGFYDGVTFGEAGGFLDTPVIFSSTQNTAGSLTQLATYNYCAVYEWLDAKGRRHRSAVSKPFTVTLTGANDEVTLTVSTAHSLRRSDTRSSGSIVETVIYRTNPDDSVFYRVGSHKPVSGVNAYASTATINDRMSNATAETQVVLYTQSQKPVENVGFYPCKYIAAGHDRLILGGLPDPYIVAFSQLPFPGEPMQGADIESEFAYQARLPEKVTAVTGFGDTYLAFTADGIYEIPGSGPQRNGTGEFFYPRSLYSDGGCIDWRSLVDTRIGLFFQMASDKLYVLDPSGTPQWIGRAVQDTLAQFPVIKAACLLTNSQRVVFAIVDSDTSPTNGGLLIYDIERKAWSFDNIGVVLSATEYNGRVAYINGSRNVFVEDSAIAQGASTLPTMEITTGSIKLFKALGYGTLCKIGILGTYLGDCTVNAFISYNDGATFTSMGSQNVTSANLFNQVSGAAISSGEPVNIQWEPPRRDVDRFSLAFTVTNNSNTGGMRFHTLSLEVEGQTHMTRQPARNRK